MRMIEILRDMTFGDYQQSWLHINKLCYVHRGNSENPIPSYLVFETIWKICE